MTFDCVDELEKLAAECPHAELVLRIRADDPSAVVQFGHKYGADPQTEAPVLLAAAKRLGMNVVGVSFHIGSGSRSCGAYELAIEAARRVFDDAAAIGYDMQLLDLGGGFWGRFDATGHVPLEDVSEAINSALASFFPPDGGGKQVEVIAEPGRYFAEACATMYALVTTVKDRPDGSRCYYITDGVYGSFNNLVYDHASVTAKVLRGPGMPPVKPFETETRLLSTVFGPTCDGVDLIFKNVPMPLLRRGDWLQFPNFGAYTIAGACAFNGMPMDNPDILYVWSDVPTGSWEHTVAVLRKGTEKDNSALQAPEHDLCFVADLHDLDSI
jgi:ornithine decarboxylase